MNKFITMLFLFALFIISTMVAVYIVRYSTAPWKLISIYWIVSATKNGFDYIKTGVNIINEGVKK